MGCYTFLCLIDIDTLDVEPFTLTLRPIDLVAVPSKVSMSLRNLVGVSAVSVFADLRSIDFCSFDFESPVLPPTSNEPVRTLCGLDGWPGRHR